MTKYLTIIILFFISSVIFLYVRDKKRSHIRELMKDPRTGTFIDKK
jgi:hypothetical protein